jgi:hypothetical protein
MTVLTVSRFPSCRVYAARGRENTGGNTGYTEEAVLYTDFSSTGLQRIGLVVIVQS